ncbi:MAG: formylglycine-generating enzyme family protein [Nitrospirae bacterium]|nr:formylglycine-generating enzyme family protein [Nitrospirota bacterium]
MHYVIFLISLLVFLPSGLYAEEKAIIGEDGAEMLFIQSGEFLMGSDDEDLKETSHLHAVYLDSFYMDKFEVTNEQFAKFLNSIKPLEDKAGQRWNWIVLRSDLDTEERNAWWPTEIIYDKKTQTYNAFPGFERYPVMSVSWYAAYAYCRWAGKRLPTEAEWEKAARGGLPQKRFPWGNEIPTGGVIFEKRWLHNAVPVPTEKIGNYHPNGYGLYDMAGNVWEWCSDWYSPNYYKKSPYRNPRGPEDGTEKVLRGGSWFNSAMLLRNAMRNTSLPDSTDDAVGFRCVMDVER